MQNWYINGHKIRYSETQNFEVQQAHLHTKNFDVPLHTYDRECWNAHVTAIVFTSLPILDCTEINKQNLCLKLVLA